jgi:hypothetical protein
MSIYKESTPWSKLINSLLSCDFLRIEQIIIYYFVLKRIFFITDSRPSWSRILWHGFNYLWFENIEEKSKNYWACAGFYPCHYSLNNSAWDLFIQYLHGFRYYRQSRDDLKCRGDVHRLCKLFFVRDLCIHRVWHLQCFGSQSHTDNERQLCSLSQ